MNESNSVERFSAAAFAAVQEVAPYRASLRARLVVDVELDRTGDDVRGYVVGPVRIEDGALVATAEFYRRSRFQVVEWIALHGTAGEVGAQLGRYVVEHGAAPARVTT